MVWFFFFWFFFFFLNSFKGVIGIFNVCDERSFVKIGDWLREAEKYTNAAIQCLLLGHKMAGDSERKVFPADALELSADLRVPFVEVDSSKPEERHKLERFVCELAAQIIQK